MKIVKDGPVHEADGAIVHLTPDELTLIGNTLKAGTFQGAIARIVADLQDKIERAKEQSANGKAG